MPFGSEYIQKAVHEVRNFESKAVDLEQAAQARAEGIVIDASTRFGGVSGAAEKVGASGLERLSGFSFLGEAGVFLLGIGGIRDSLKIIPLPSAFGIKAGWNAAIDWFFSPYNNFENYVLTSTDRLARDVIPGWQGFMDYLLPKTTTVQHITENIQPGSANLGPLETQISNLQKTVVYQQSEISRLQSQVSVKPVFPSPNLVPLDDQLHAVQGQLTNLANDLANVHAIDTGLRADVDRLASEVNSLAQELHGVRSTVASWPDVEQQLEATMFATQRLISQVITTQQLHTSQINPLLALGLLLEPGIAGLKNLRRLEDNPCQCPQFGDIPNELGTAISIYELLTHG